MRFAISLLSLISIASIIGTVLKQNEPMANYVNQFGPFWFEMFRTLSLYSVYSSWWFLLIMAFLVLSTGLCLIRNTPKMLKDMRSWRDNVREQSLKNFAHKAEWSSELSRTALAAHLRSQLAQRGYKTKLVGIDHATSAATLIVGKQGAATKLGYIFAHSAIIIILIGGLLDSDLSIRFEQWFMGKVPFEGNGIISQIAQKHRLSMDNPTFRGNTMISEGQVSSSAIIPQPNGIFIQDLPFSIRLNKFIIEFYSTGMPKLFASEVEVQDPVSGKTFPAVIKVNEPLVYQGVAIYQSSFEDGGSKLQLTAYPMAGANDKAFSVSGEVGGNTSFNTSNNAPPDRLHGASDEQYSIEWTGFRPFNVENMSDVRSVKKEQALDQQIMSSLSEHSGSAAKGINAKDLKNVGASVQYKLRDKNGQAREFSNYMQSVKIDNAWVFLAGVRDSPSESFRYLRIPADDNDSVHEWMRIRAALMNPSTRAQAAGEYAKSALAGTQLGTSPLHVQLATSAERGLDIFAGDGKVAGYAAVSQFLEKIPLEEQAKAAEVFIKLLNGSLWKLWQVARQKEGLPDLELNEKHAQFLELASNALSESFFYNAPIYLQLNSYDEVKASVLQVTRSPGKNVVYLGCILLVVGIFSMLYIRERRVWIWVRDQPLAQGSYALLAISTQRKTIDFEKEFVQLKTDLAS
ncbi:MAG: Cytochrome c-type biosis protein Ccs1/ResB [Solimicrobium sp.]|nr:Cytochrome c-type biosis protein Ccs1/ResB [Solimicrobium sp.]